MDRREFVASALGAGLLHFVDVPEPVEKNTIGFDFTGPKDDWKIGVRQDVTVVEGSRSRDIAPHFSKAIYPYKPAVYDFRRQRTVPSGKGWWDSEPDPIVPPVLLKFAPAQFTAHLCGHLVSSSPEGEHFDVSLTVKDSLAITKPMYNAPAQPLLDVIAKHMSLDGWERCFNHVTADPVLKLGLPGSWVTYFVTMLNWYMPGADEVRARYRNRKESK